MRWVYCTVIGNFDKLFLSVLQSKCLMMSESKLNQFYQPWVDVTVEISTWEYNKWFETGNT